MKKFQKIIILLMIIPLMLCGCSKKEQTKIDDKVSSELGYLNDRLIDILNNLNNITFQNYTIMSESLSINSQQQKAESKNDKNSSEKQENGSEKTGEQEENQGKGQGGENEQNTANATEMITNAILTIDRNNIDWNIIKSDIEIINEAWGTILLDLYSKNVSNDNILDFSNKLNVAIIAIKNENKKQSLNAVSELYADIPLFIKETGGDKNLRKIRQMQSYIIKAYTLADDMNNAEIARNMNQAVEIYSEVMSDIDYTKDKTYKINKIYVLLNELNNAVLVKDSDVFYIKYKNLMQAIYAI